MRSSFRSTAQIAAVVALLAVGCRASFERTMPRALSAHTAGLQSSSEIQVAVESSWSAHWNRIAGAVASSCGVAVEDVNQGVLQSHFCYESSGDALVARQSRTRFVVRFPPGATSTESLSLDAITEIRERRAGSAPGAWVSSAPNTAQAQVLRQAIETATASRRNLPIQEVRFEEEPDAALRRLSQRMSPYVEAERTVDGLVTEWRTTDEPVGDGSLILRSRLRFFAEREGGGTEISVVAQLQSRRIEDNSTPPPTETWSDIDPGTVLAHGLGIVQQSLSPAPIAIGDEPVQIFASGPPAEPDLSDPAATWDRGRLPQNVATSRETAEGLMLCPSQATEQELLGAVYDSRGNPTQGRAVPVGEVVQTSTRQVHQAFRQLDFDWEISANADYLGVARASASYASNQRIVVFSTIAQERRAAMPEYIRFDGLSTAAAYYVSEIIFGRSVDAVFQVDERRLAGEIGASYEGFSATVSASTRNGEVRCETKSRGVEQAPSCSPISPPTAAQMEAALSRPVNDPVPVFLVLRRVPDRFRVGVRTFDIELRSIKANSAGQGWGDADLDLNVTVARHGTSPVTFQCPEDTNHCVFGTNNQPRFRAENIPLGTNEAIGVNVIDRDVSFHDDLGTVSVRLADVIGSTPVERRRVAAEECRRSNYGSPFEFTFCVHDR